MRNIVLTCYLTTFPDPQRGYRWPTTTTALRPLIDSVNKDELVILHDCFECTTLPCENHFVTSRYPAQQQRWHSYHQYLTNHPANLVWLVDATDVRQLNNPWDLKPDSLYIGSIAYETLDIDWIHDHTPTINPEWLQGNRNRMLLNPGTLGGEHHVVLEFCEQMITHWAGNPDIVDQCEEMAYANMIAYNTPNLVTADVCTLFRAEQTSHPTAIWQHK